MLESLNFTNDINVAMTSLTKTPITQKIRHYILNAFDMHQETAAPS